MPNLRTIDQPEPLSRIAYQSLRDSIINGDLKRGKIYNEMALAKELGISRTPVREALLELSAQGLVSFLPRRGVVVNDYSQRDVEEVFEVRKAIELFAVGRVAGMEPRPDLAEVVETMEGQRAALAAGSKLDYLRADRIFHLSFSRLLGNQRLQAILDNIRDLVQVMSLGALARAGRDEEVIQEHQRVIEAVERGDPGTARRAMEEHLDRSREAVLARFREEDRTG